MHQELSLKLMDTHAGGDVSRIVLGGIDPLPGETVRQPMEYLRDDADGLRRLLLEEPYGIPEMSVDLIVPPSHPDASVGYIIMEVMGYAIYSGSNTICTATAVLESGLVPKEEGRQSFMMESPAGLVHIEAQVRDGVVESITCGGLPSYIHTHRATIHVPSLGNVTYSVAYSGGFYALVDAAELGFHLTLDEEAEQLIDWIRSGELKPVLHAAFKLSDLHRAEDYFVSRGNNFLGKIVIVPDRQWADFGEPFALKETT